MDSSNLLELPCLASTLLLYFMSPEHWDLSAVPQFCARLSPLLSGQLL